MPSDEQAPTLADKLVAPLGETKPTLGIDRTDGLNGLGSLSSLGFIGLSGKRIAPLPDTDQSS